MIDFDFIPLVEEATKGSHKVYLYNWETKTQFAEANGVWNSDIQHRVHMAIENLAPNVESLGLALAQALARIDALEAALKNQK